MPSPIGHALAGVITAWTADLVPGKRRWRTAAATASWFARAGDGLTLACAGLAAAADADLLLPTGAHRAFTHSAGAVLAVTIIAAGVTGWVTRKRTHNAELAENVDRRRSDTRQETKSAELAAHAEEGDRTNSARSAFSAVIVLRVALMCGAAYASHVLLDWMAVDDTFPYGIRALWPFSHGWYISGWNLFPGTARRALMSRASLVENARAFGWEVAILVPIAAMVWLVRVKALARFAAEVPRGDHAPQ